MVGREPHFGYEFTKTKFRNFWFDPEMKGIFVVNFISKALLTFHLDLVILKDMKQVHLQCLQDRELSWQ